MFYLKGVFTWWFCKCIVENLLEKFQCLLDCHPGMVQCTNNIFILMFFRKLLEIFATKLNSFSQDLICKTEKSAFIKKEIVNFSKEKEIVFWIFMWDLIDSHFDMHKFISLFFANLQCIMHCQFYLGVHFIIYIFGWTHRKSDSDVNLRIGGFEFDSEILGDLYKSAAFYNSGKWNWKINFHFLLGRQNLDCGHHCSEKSNIFMILWKHFIWSWSCHLSFKWEKPKSMKSLGKMKYYKG